MSATSGEKNSGSMNRRCELSQADFIVKTGIAKSVGLPDGGKFEASCAFEITLDITVLSDKERLPATIKEAYKACLDSVNGQIHAATNVPAAPPEPVKKIEKPPESPGTFGQWLKERLTESGMDTATFVKTVYQHAYKEVPPENWQDAGSKMNADWNGSGGMFKNVLDKAFLDSLGN